MGYPSKVPRCVKVSIWGWGEQTESIRQLTRVKWGVPARGNYSPKMHPEWRWTQQKLKSLLLYIWVSSTCIFDSQTTPDMCIPPSVLPFTNKYNFLGNDVHEKLCASDWLKTSAFWCKTAVNQCRAQKR